MFLSADSNGLWKLTLDYGDGKRLPHDTMHFTLEEMGDLIALLKTQFCMECGDPDTGCQCWNDE